MTRQKKDPDKVIRYLVKAAEGEFIIEIPASWKITFGFVNPAKSGDSYGRGEGHCLRVYEGEKLRAVYADVRGFRDLSIPLARKVQKETGSTQWTQDSSGNFERSTKVEVESELVLEAGEAPF